jgi:hypothetical protein
VSFEDAIHKQPGRENLTREQAWQLWVSPMGAKHLSMPTREEEERAEYDKDASLRKYLGKAAPTWRGTTANPFAPAAPTVAPGFQPPAGAVAPRGDTPAITPFPGVPSGPRGGTPAITPFPGVPSGSRPATGAPAASGFPSVMPMGGAGGHGSGGRNTAFAPGWRGSGGGAATTAAAPAATGTAAASSTYAPGFKGVRRRA